MNMNHSCPFMHFDLHSCPFMPPPGHFADVVSVGHAGRVGRPWRGCPVGLLHVGLATVARSDMLHPRAVLLQRLSCWVTDSVYPVGMLGHAKAATQPPRRLDLGTCCGLPPCTGPHSHVLLDIVVPLEGLARPCFSV